MYVDRWVGRLRLPNHGKLGASHTTRHTRGIEVGRTPCASLLCTYAHFFQTQPNLTFTTGNRRDTQVYTYPLRRSDLRWPRKVSPFPTEQEDAHIGSLGGRRALRALRDRAQHDDG